ncbi:MAG: hypothetical protein NTW64_03965 [Candidatus Omnitrophica bacterium]|nr:hypothetical protein [Candidatus Omnitrophota bacterium]
MTVLLGVPIKDWLIIIASFILIFSILEIRKLKKNISHEIHKRILPQLNLEIILDANIQNSGIYLRNESFFIARDIKLDNLEIVMDDLGYKYTLILKFEGVDSLRAQEKVKLKFQVFDKNLIPLPEVTERIIPHLTGMPFKMELSYSNIENVKSHVVFSKTGKQLCIESATTSP